MLINETSRLSQLTPAGITLLSKVLEADGILFNTVSKEIEDTVFAMSEDSYTESIAWYANANEFVNFLAIQSDVSTEVAAGVVSAVSPRMPWLRNKSVARSILSEFRKYESLSAVDAAKEIGLGLSANVAMAVKIARGESIADTLTGTKRRSFYNNIVAPNHGDSVTIDTWMVRALMNTSSMSLKSATDFLRKSQTALGGTGAGYYVLAESVRNVAALFGVKPCQVQSAYWVAVSGHMNGGRTDIKGE